MILIEIALIAFGHFSDRRLVIGDGRPGLTLIEGPNEAGKSTLLRALIDLRFGIPHVSPDAFDHAYGDLRIAGRFRDAQGREQWLVRVKRRTGLWVLPADADPAALSSLDGATPADAALQAALTGGLERAEYETLYGLDHARLRAGGEALVRGEGDVGAALFEASAGLTSLPAVVADLDRGARQWFIPGTRGRNAPINEALLAIDSQQRMLREQLVRPAHWARLQAEHESAGRALAESAAALRKERVRLAGLSELRGVAPILHRLDAAQARLEALPAGPALDAEAGQRRSGVEAGLALALAQWEEVRREQVEQERGLAALPPGPPLLRHAPAIDRLHAASEGLDELEARRGLAQLASDQLETQLRARFQDLEQWTARRLDAVGRAGLDQLLERADALLQRDAALGPVEGGDEGEAEQEGADDADPTAAQRLRAAHEALSQAVGMLERAETLPGELIEAGAAALAHRQALGLDPDGREGREGPALKGPTADPETALRGGAALNACVPLGDEQIDVELQRRRDHARDLEEAARRLIEVERSLGGTEARQRALAAGELVVTPEAVRAARSRRDQLWDELLRWRPAPAEDARQVPLFDVRVTRIEAYRELVERSDQLADRLAADIGRATELAALARDRDQQQGEHRRLLAARQRALLDGEEGDRQWQALLLGHGLPSLPPDAMRAWQDRLQQARGAFARHVALRQEQDRIAIRVGALTEDLSAALAGLGHEAAGPGASSRGLLVRAGQVLRQLDREQEARLTRAGARVEAQRQRRSLALRRQDLEVEARALVAALAPRFAERGLVCAGAAPDAPLWQALAQDARALEAHLRDLDRFEADWLAWQQARVRAEEPALRLAAVQAQADALADALGERVPDTRLYAGALATRLAEARSVDQQRRLLEQALTDTGTRAAALTRRIEDLRAGLAALCVAAGVDGPAALPEAEREAALRREATAERDRARLQLEEVSPRPADWLRERLAGRDSAELAELAAASEEEIDRLELALEAARHRELEARQARDAIDAGATAADAREALEQAAARVRGQLPNWVRNRLAAGLLEAAQRRFRERAQGPMLGNAGRLFASMTDGRFVRLLGDEAQGRPILVVERADGRRLHIEALSEGTRDQLFLALRLAALALRRRPGVDLPVILDDVLMTSDDGRAARMLAALALFAREHQVLVLTHHAHLLGLAPGRADGAPAWHARLEGSQHPRCNRTRPRSADPIEDRAS